MPRFLADIRILLCASSVGLKRLAIAVAGCEATHSQSGSEQLEWRKSEVAGLQPLLALAMSLGAARPATVDYLPTTSLGPTQLL